MGSRLLLPCLTICLLGLPSVSLAVDGRHEINQTCAVQTGCFSGDAAGFPVSITARGSYVLTSDLDEPSGSSNVIVIEANRVDLDLNGFTLGYCLSIPLCRSATSGSGIVGGDQTDVRVRNGIVRGTAGHGIFLGARARVTDVHSLDHGFDGIRLGNGGLVDRCTVSANGDNGVHLQGGASMLINSVVTNNADFGLIGILGTPYRGNVFTGNNSGAEVQLNQGHDAGGNFCGNTPGCP